MSMSYGEFLAALYEGEQQITSTCSPENPVTPEEHSEPWPVLERITFTSSTGCPDPAKCMRGPGPHQWSSDCELDEGWADL